MLSPTEHGFALATVLGLDAPPQVAARPASPFDNTSDDLVLNDAVAEAALATTERAVDQAIAPGDTSVSLDLTKLDLPIGAYLDVVETGRAWWQFRDPGAIDVDLDLPWAGTWTVRVRTARVFFYEDFSVPADLRDAELDVEIPDAGSLTTVAVETPDVLNPHEVDVTWHAGPGAVRVRLTARPGGDNTIIVDAITASGVPDDPAAAQRPSRERLLACDGDATCLRDQFQRLARLAWRGPVDSARVERLVDLATSADTAEIGVRDAVIATLMSPEFLFRVEPAGATSRALTPHELAARLSFALWADLPDEPLLDCADAGGLAADDTGPCGLGPQVDRMLGDVRSSRAAAAFGAQWLGVTGLDALVRSPQRYPTWSVTLARSMRAEVEATLRRSWEEQRPVVDLLAATETWVDGPLSRHYGVEAPPGGAGFVPRPTSLVELAAVLTATSEPSRTSIVRRGAWVLSALLCQPPDPPPAGVQALAAGQTDEAELLSAHLAPSCAACHAGIDPYGVALQAFDAIGAARDAHDDGTAYETTATLPNGAVIDGPGGLAHAAHPELLGCLTEKAFTWAIARRPNDADRVVLRSVQASVAPDASWRDVVRAIVVSPAFRTRGADVGGVP